MTFEKVMYTPKAHTTGDERHQRSLRPARLGKPRYRIVLDVDFGSR